MAKLLRKKHPQSDMFICDILDATPKDDIASMEHPFFSLSKKPDTRARKYEHNGEYIEITPSILGIATIKDKDILIFAVSQLMAKINAGEKPSQTIQFSAYDLLVSTNRATDGDEYRRLKTAFQRLDGTRIVTCIKTGGKEITEGFGLIDYWKIIRKTRKGRMEGLELKLSDWLYNSILSNQVLSLSPDYFRLSRPLERRIYEICRKHCGKQEKWSIYLQNLHKKTGATAALRNFRIDIKNIIESDHLPDYKIYFDDKKDLLIVRPRTVTAPKPETKKLRLKSQTYDTARKILKRNFDVYAVESEWLSFWEMTGCPELKTPDGAFINFCNSAFVPLFE